MNKRNNDVSGLIIHMSVEQAVQIFEESGDLTFTKFPGIMRMAEDIGKLLSRDRNESAKSPKPMIVFSSKGTTFAHRRTKN